MKITTSRKDLHIHENASIFWTVDKIPYSVAKLEQWVKCYNIGEIDKETQKPITTPKRPMGPPTPLNHNCRSLPDHAVDNYAEQHFGLILAEDDETIILDVDNLPVDFEFSDLPSPIQDILQTFPSYAEISPSGQGLHVLYHCDKSDAVFDAYTTSAKIETTWGTLYLKNQFLTFTGHVFPYPESVDSVSSIKPRFLTSLCPMTSTSPAYESLALTPHRIDYTLEYVEQLLSQIPPSINHHPDRDLFFITYANLNNPLDNPSDYEHWRTVAAGTHHAAAALGKPQEGARIFVDWSAQDTENFESAEVAERKYYDNPPKEGGITISTIRKLAHGNKPRWPKLTPKGSPILTNMYNWEYLFDERYQLTFKQNEITKAYSIDGPEFTVNSFFGGPNNVYQTREDIGNVLLSVAQSHYLPMATSSHIKDAVGHMLRKAKVFNPIRDMIEAESEVMVEKEGSHFQQLFETLIFADDMHEDQIELCRIYLKKNLMGLIRAHFYKGDFGGTTGVVIITGPEASYKSTWVSMLLPQSLRLSCFGTSSVALKADMKELQLEAARYQILCFDEIERLLSRNIGNTQKATDSLLKNFLVQTTDSYRPLFGKEPISVPRKCIFFGTTNHKTLAITDNGSRRIQIIPIQKCDTSALTKVNMARVYRELYQEFMVTPLHEQSELWNLTKAELHETNKLNSTTFKETSNIETVLTEIFGSPSPLPYADLESELFKKTRLRRTELMKGKRLWTRMEIQTLLEERGAGKLSPNVVTTTMKRFCGQYTDTTNKSKKIHDYYIEDGYLTKPKKCGKGNAMSLWLTPTPIALTNFEEEDHSESLS